MYCRFCFLFCHRRRRRRRSEKKWKKEEAIDGEMN